MRIATEAGEVAVGGYRCMTSNFKARPLALKYRQCGQIARATAALLLACQDGQGVFLLRSHSAITCQLSRHLSTPTLTIQPRERKPRWRAPRSWHDQLEVLRLGNYGRGLPHLPCLLFSNFRSFRLLDIWNHSFRAYTKLSSRYYIMCVLYESPFFDFCLSEGYIKIDAKVVVLRPKTYLVRLLTLSFEILKGLAL